MLLALTLGACTSASPKGAAPVSAVSAEINKAHEQERRRQYHLARAHYQRALTLAEDPKSLAFAHREFASALLFWGEYAAARGQLIKSLKADETQIQAWHDLGILQARSGEKETARASFERALALDPSEPRTHIAIAALLVGMNEFREAEAHYQVLLTLDVPPKITKASRRAIVMLRAEMARGASSRPKSVPPKQ